MKNIQNQAELTIYNFNCMGRQERSTLWECDRRAEKDSPDGWVLELYGR